MSQAVHLNGYSERVGKLKEKFHSAGQDQVFQFVNTLSKDKLELLLADLEEIDPQEVNADYLRAKEAKSAPSSVDPFPNVCPYEGTQKERTQWEAIGFQKIHEGKTAVLLLAGGQGTRLGTVNPKGMYDIGLPSGHSLFQIQAERIIKIQRLAAEHMKSSNESVVPWYIMTSESTKGMTIAYFEQNNYFGLDKTNVFFFEQATIPCLTPEGKIIMQSPYKVARAPNGNGGLYQALLISGALADMEKRGVEMVSVYGVDNCLIKMADPVFFGYGFDKKLDCAAKVVAKASPDEAVGVVCLSDGKPGVIEYSEIPTETAHKVDPKTNKLVYNAAHICINMFSVPFLKRVCASKLKSLPFHVAKKKIPSVNKDGNPEDINGWKLEMFIFDVFEFSENMGALEVLRSEEFSPLKNAPGSKSDCPETCRRHLSDLHKSWLINAGAHITNKEEPLGCEVSPLISYKGEGLERHVKGKTFTIPFYLR